jgi:RNA polymerase sigma factor for flagellar operon FliA
MSSLTGTSSSSGRDSSFRTDLLQQINSGRLLWAELDLKSKEALVESFGQKVKIVAWRLKAKLPNHVSIDDLLGSGSLGLLEGLGHFDPSMKVKLETFVENRIRGAMLDELRRQDWFSRGLRKNIRIVEQSRHSFEQEHGRGPSQEELVRATGLTEKDVEQAQEALEHQVLVSLDQLEPHKEPSRNDDEAYTETLHQELVAKLSDHIQSLTHKEQLVLSMYYDEELTMKETAEVLDITEGRVSQLHSQALKKLRSLFRQEKGPAAL